MAELSDERIREIAIKHASEQMPGQPFCVQACINAIHQALREQPASREQEPASADDQAKRRLIAEVQSTGLLNLKSSQTATLTVIYDIEHDAKILRRYVPESCLGMVDGILATIANNRSVFGGEPCGCDECKKPALREQPVSREQIEAVIRKHMRHIELSPGAGKAAQDYAIATCEDILADVRSLAHPPVSRDAVLVPAEPTTEMVNAGVEAMRNDGWSLDRDELAATLQLVYKAMLSAGTQP